MPRNHTFTLIGLSEMLDNIIANYERNNVSADNAEVVIENCSENDKYNINTISYDLEHHNPKVRLSFFESNKIDVRPEDIRPRRKGYEFVRFMNLNTDLTREYKDMLHVDVMSIQAAERIIRYIKYLKESDDIKTNFSWNKLNPRKVRISFMASEFDTINLQKMINESKYPDCGDYYITEEMIQKTIKL